MNKKDDVLNSVQDSYLTDEQKKDLINYVNKNGENQEFYTLFNGLLIKEYDKILNKYKKNVENYQRECFVLDQEIFERERQLEKQLKEKLAAINNSDVLKKELLLDSYYKEVNRFHEESEDKLRDLSAKQILDTLVEG